MDILKNCIEGVYKNKYNKYPERFLKQGLNIEIFKDFLVWCKNYTKEDITIFLTYHYYYDRIPIDAEMYYIMEVYDNLSLEEYVTLICNLLILFHQNKLLVYFDDLYVYIKLFAKIMTIEEVINENNNKKDMEILISNYLNMLNEKITFNDIYNEIAQHVDDSDENRENEIRKKLKALYCSEILYERQKSDNFIKNTL